MWSLSDEALLAGLRSGDPEAAAAFVRRYQSRVFGLALTILGDRALAEEAAQETFLKIWKHADAYDVRRGHVSTWVLSITRNTSVDAARLKRADPLDPHALVALCEREDQRDTNDPLIAGLDLDRVKETVRTLPEEQKVALMQAAFYGRTAREIAEIEDVPLGTVKTRIRTALIKVRAALEVSDDT